MIMNIVPNLNILFSILSHQIVVLFFIGNIHHVINSLLSLFKPVILILTSPFSILAWWWMRRDHVTQLPFTMIEQVWLS